MPHPPPHARRTHITRAPGVSALCGLLLALLATSWSSWLFGAQSGRHKKPSPVATSELAGKMPSPPPRPVMTTTTAPATTETTDHPLTSATPGPQVETNDAPAPNHPPDTPPPAPSPTPAISPTPGPLLLPAPTTLPTSPNNPLADEVDEEEVVRVNSNLVPVPAYVLDAQGKAVTDLELKDFELRVDGQLKSIGEVNRAETPVRMAVLFDNSSSMTPAREFELKAAIQFFKKVMRPIDQAALYAISTDPTLVRPLTNEVNALVRAIEHFPKPEGATSLFDTIVQAAEYLRPQPYRKVIIIVSDGVETTSRIESFDEVLRRVQAADCQIYALQTGNSEHPNLRDLVAERRLQVFAAETGGAVYTPRNVGDLDRAFAQISTDLAQQYVLSYYPSGERRDGRFHAFSLRISTRPNLRVRTRKGYYAPKG